MLCHVEAISVSDRPESWTRREFVGGLTLAGAAGLIVNSKAPAEFKIVGESLSEEPIAIIIPKDDPAYKKLVDDTVIGLMKSGELDKIYTKWFMSPIPPRNATVGMAMSASLKNAIANPNDKPAETYKK